MAYNHEWPYSDLGRANTDWVIHEVKELIRKMEEFTGYNEIKFADPINWSSTTYYKRYTIVLYTDGNSYISKSDVPVGIPPVETMYWAKVADFNAQLEEVEEELEAIGRKVCYITPQQFGAAGDGVTDDYQAFADALEYSSEHDATMIVVPPGEYKISQQLVIDHPAIIVGASIGTACKLIAPNGISIKFQNVIIKDIYIYGDNTKAAGSKTGYGISIDGECNNITLEGVYFAHYSKCIYHTDYFFGLTLNGCRFYASDWAMDLNDLGVGLTVYDVNFNDCWFLTTTKLFDLDHCKVTFNHCIIDINSAACISTSNNAYVAFNDSTFEMTTNVDGSAEKYIMYADGSYIFNNCYMIENSDPSVYWYVVTASTRKIVMNNCRLTAYNPDVKCGGLINPTFSAASNYGVVEISECEFYNASVYALDDIRAFAPRFNIIDGVGIQIFDGSYDTAKMTRSHKYSRFNTDGAFVGEFVWNGFILRPSTNPMPADAGAAVGLYEYSSTPYDVLKNGYIYIYKGSSNGADIQLTLYGPGGSRGITAICKNGVSNIIPVFTGMRVKVVNANNADDFCQFVPFE